MPKKETSKKTAGTPETQTITQQEKTVDTNAQLEKSMQVIPTEEFDPERVIYSDPEQKEIPGGKGNYRVVKVQYRYSDGTRGPILFQLSEKYSYGVKPDNLDLNGEVRTDDDGKPQKMKNYQVSMPMYDSKSGQTAQDQMEIDLLDGFQTLAQHYAVQNKKKLGKGNKSDQVMKDLVKTILFRKKKTGKELENLNEGESPYQADYVPQLYTKLLYFLKDNKCETVFYGPGDKQLDPRRIDGGFYLIPTLMIDSMFIGEKGISWQHKLYDGTVRFRESRPRARLAPKNTAVSTESTETTEENESASADVSEADEQSE
jgi:hypothetical protein